jgi:hypothetical protein
MLQIHVHRVCHTLATVLLDHFCALSSHTQQPHNAHIGNGELVHNTVNGINSCSARQQAGIINWLGRPDQMQKIKPSLVLTGLVNTSKGSGRHVGLNHHHMLMPMQCKQASGSPSPL